MTVSGGHMDSIQSGPLQGNAGGHVHSGVAVGFSNVVRPASQFSFCLCLVSRFLPSLKPLIQRPLPSKH